MKGDEFTEFLHSVATHDGRIGIALKGRNRAGKTETETRLEALEKMN